MCVCVCVCVCVCMEDGGMTVCNEVDDVCDVKKSDVRGAWVRLGLCM